MSDEAVSGTGTADSAPPRQDSVEAPSSNEMTTLVTPRADHISWRRILGVGLVLYVVGLLIYGLTDSLTLFPTLMLLGSFLVPVTYVAFFYQHRHLSTVSFPTVARTFFYGGVLGGLAATALEAFYVAGLQNVSLSESWLSAATFLGGGLIEEAVKILGVLVVARRARHEAEIDGIILGAAAGMGFAALESSGYVFAAFVASRGSLSAALLITVLRGVLAPLGHGTWTAIIASILFRETRNGRFRFDRAVVGAYLTAAILHALWNGAVPIMALSLPLPLATFLAVFLVVPVVGATGLLVLWLRWREAVRRQERGAFVGDLRRKSPTN